MQIFRREHNGCMAHHSIDPHPDEIKFPLHVHPHCEVFYFMRGAGYYTVEGRDYPLSPGSILLMRDGEIHKLHINPDAPYERMAIHFPLEQILGKSTPFEDLRSLFLDRSPGCGNLFTPKSGESASFLAACFSRICRPNQDAAEFDLTLRAHLPALLAELHSIQEHPTHAPAVVQPGGDAVLAEVIDYINCHLTELKGLCELEQHFFFSKSTLNRLFTESTGSTVWEYVVLKRLHAARRMLLDGKSAAISAAASGFGDYSAFYRQYRRVFGESPRRERKSGKKAQDS